MNSARRQRGRRRVSVPSSSTDKCLSSPRRSSNSVCSTSSSSSGNSSSSNAAAGGSSSCTPCSPSFECLEKISMRLDVEEEKSARNPTKTQAVYYVLHVRHAACNVVWHRRLALTAYLDFQQQLLAILKQGHVCPGDCPWLYSFVTSYFPTNSTCPFKLNCPKWIAKRHAALTHCMTAIHGFLRTRENQNCEVLRTSVRKAFTAFVYGELGPSHPLLSSIKVNEELVGDESAAKSPSGASLDSRSSLASTTSSGSGSSSSALSSSGSGSSSSDDTSAVPACPLCHSRLDEDAAPFAESVLPVRAVSSVSSSSSSGSSRRASRLYYATTLRCGHEFHEECVLQWLNQALSCPVCGQSEVEA